MLTSRDTGSCTIEKLDTENMGIAVEILLLCALEFKICLGVKYPPPSCRRTSKTVAGTRVKDHPRSLESHSRSLKVIRNNTNDTLK